MGIRILNQACLLHFFHSELFSYKDLRKYMEYENEILINIIRLHDFADQFK